MLAKSDPPISLQQHTADVESAAACLQGIWECIPSEVRLAAHFHDFGKAASGFQEMLRGGPKWEFRHEFLSAAIFKQCFNIEEEPWRRAYLAVLTHHKNLGSLDAVAKPFLEGSSNSPYSRWFQKWAELNVKTLKQTFQPTLDHWSFDPATPSPANEASAIIATLKPAFEDMPLTLLRGALVAADHLASSQIGNPIQGSHITLAALERYMQANCKEEDGSEWKRWKKIQEDAAAVQGSAALVAPTGAGKTEAALRWVLANRRGYERVFYVLPYQVSINAMAERISRAFPDEEDHTKVSENENVAILHSNTDLAYLQDALNDEIAPQKAALIARNGKQAARKIYSPIKVTTVYQLLDIFFGRKFFEVGLLELTNALVIFDEIHAYDGHTLGLVLVLLEYLRRLNARVFIMTATLPEKLKSALMAAAGITQEIRLASNDTLLSEVRRRIVLKNECLVQELAEEIRQAVLGGKRTVVVCNTVDKALSMRQLLDDLNPLLLHSRFTIGDRARREIKQKIEQYPLVISTQVIEVSLDISFDVMFTELAPVDSLLQRFGRVNRHGRVDQSRPGICYIACEDDSGSQKIYDPQLLERTRQNIPDAPLSFEVACRWIECVYPNGLPQTELDEMNGKQALFAKVVANLRPMLDAPDIDLEKNLFRSVQVVPAKYEKTWLDYKNAGKHMEAKCLLVNVDERVWNGAKQRASKEGRQASRTMMFNQREQLVALFEYDEDEGDQLTGTGLRLDRPLPDNSDVEDRIL